MAMSEDWASCSMPIASGIDWQAMYLAEKSRAEAAEAALGEARELLRQYAKAGVANSTDFALQIEAARNAAVFLTRTSKEPTHD